jgi:hypothetical protein
MLRTAGQEGIRIAFWEEGWKSWLRIELVVALAVAAHVKAISWFHLVVNNTICC